MSVTFHSVLLENGMLVTYGNINSGKLVLDLDFCYDVCDPATKQHPSHAILQLLTGANSTLYCQKSAWSLPFPVFKMTFGDST
eukprot:CAMPEP_0202491652 /NCGR_PEP_ID=MMETSP1361-20130828/8640_1 /ASSEMBLY_ACC=CAM_ASM_000849 /TAXON_ID=210615 /ORGANISM="Staurosira complex sp., Strain CCMP2646" /LENGTH=82 /DNA_ID=CAMNT_0049121739 /DNA_START=468 /DNA_END=712 /DNA_ORIENTATION=+